jgi:threonine aldolase
MVHAPERPPAGAPPVRINLYSDTQTRPTPAMKDAMMRAEVGDEQAGADPTVHLLCDRMAALMGKEAGGLHAVRHDVQRRRDADPLPPGRGDHRA